MPVTPVTPLLICFVEDLINSRVITNVQFSFIRNSNHIGSIRHQETLHELYKAIQEDKDQELVDHYAGLLTIELYRLRKESICSTKLLVVFCRDNMIYCDLFDARTPTPELCAMASGLATLKQMAITASRGSSSNTIN